jgi:hypothetical protein
MASRGADSKSMDKNRLEELRDIAAAKHRVIVISNDRDPKSATFEKGVIIGGNGRSTRIGRRGHAAASAAFARGDALDLDGIARELERLK